MTDVEWARVGVLCARLHAVPTEWVDDIEAAFRAELAASATPSLASVPRESHMWIFLFRGKFGLRHARNLLPARALRWPPGDTSCPELLHRLEGTWRPTRVDEWTET